MKERKYRAFWDDGHDYGDFEFYSYHRAGSKRNLEDAEKTARKKMGFSLYNKIEITDVQLLEEN